MDGKLQLVLIRSGVGYTTRGKATGMGYVDQRNIDVGERVVTAS